MALAPSWTLRTQGAVPGRDEFLYILVPEAYASAEQHRDHHDVHVALRAYGYAFVNTWKTMRTKR